MRIIPKCKEDLFRPPFVYRLEKYLNMAIGPLKNKYELKGVAIKIKQQRFSHTNGLDIVIGSKNPLFYDGKIIPTNCILLTLGTCLHELGHIIYSPFSAFIMAEDSIKKGSFWPAAPVHPGAKAVCSYIKECKSNNFILRNYHMLLNILEDGRIEYILLKHNSNRGLLIKGLLLLRKGINKGLPNFSANLDELDRCSDQNQLVKMKLQFLFNAVLSLARLGHLNGLEERHNNHELIKVLDNVTDHISSALDSVNADSFMRRVNYIFVEFFDYIRDVIETLSEEDTESQDMFSSVSAFTDDDIKNEEAQVAEDLTKKIKEHLSESKEISSSKEDLLALEKDFSKDALKEQDGFLHSLEDNKEPVSDDAGIVDIDMISNLPISYESQEDMICDELNIGAFACENLSIGINREFYKKYKSSLSQYSDFLKAGALAAKKIRPFLNLQHNITVEKKRFSGTRFKACRVANPNLRYFDKKARKPLSPTLSVAILIDESGSMFGDKIEAAKATALALYEMCEILEINFAVFGHTADIYDSDLYINNYCYFGESGDDVKRRLLSIRESYNNRDGAALRYVSDILHKQNSEKKLLIIISDGKPFARGYSGKAAEEDIKKVIEDYERLGIRYIAAAIDSDKEDIKRIYKAERFLDINDLSTLPSKLMSIVKKSLSR